VIEHIEIEGFKSLEKVSLDLGALNIFVGTNASGKSNFLEALRVLQGIGYGYSIEEILNGRPKFANNEAWEGIRGGSTYAGFRGSAPGEGIIRFRVRASWPSLGAPVRYGISISPKYGFVSSESLSIGDKVIYDLSRERSLDMSSPILGHYQIAPQDAHAVVPFRRQLMDVQALEPSTSVQREYSTASVANRMGDHGENFAALVKTILKSEPAASAYVSWLKELTPSELDEVKVLSGAAGDWLFALQRNGKDYPAPVLSDGTLRFAAIAATFFQPSQPCMLILEEIENGLHPTRLRLLVELLKSQAGKGISQVMATSHSPFAISWLKEEDYRTVFLCTKDDATGATSITPFSSIPRLVELARKQPIADLFAEGWLESAV
jgi:energy-coupling factor transporter ATP-binding protein EcfA2